jgi:hypothetical protein
MEEAGKASVRSLVWFYVRGGGVARSLLLVTWGFDFWYLNLRRSPRGPPSRRFA